MQGLRGVVAPWCYSGEGPAVAGRRAGHSTEAMATTISSTAVQSCQCTGSFSHTAPLNTPTTGIIITLPAVLIAERVFGRPN